MRNYYGRGLCYLPKPKAEANNFSYPTRTEFNNCFINLYLPTFPWRSHLYFEFWHKQHKPFVFCIWHKQHKFQYTNKLRHNVIYVFSISEMNITGTLPPLLLIAKSWSQILRDTSPRHACLGEVSRESASRQSRELIMRSERTTNVQRGDRCESQGRVNLPFV